MKRLLVALLLSSCAHRSQHLQDLQDLPLPEGERVGERAYATRATKGRVTLR